jgi:hypothetical protein
LIGIIGSKLAAINPAYLDRKIAALTPVRIPNKDHRVKLPLIPFVALLTYVLARLGDTETDLIERYGQPVHRVETVDGLPGVKGRTFRVSPITVTAYLLDKTCQYEQYSKIGGLTDNEIEQILAANSAGQEWMALDKPQTPSNRREWMRRDQKAAAFYERLTLKLKILTMDFSRYIKFAQEAESAEALKKF